MPPLPLLPQSEALGYLRQWVTRHPKHADAAAQVQPIEDSSQAAHYVVSGALSRDCPAQGLLRGSRLSACCGRAAARKGLPVSHHPTCPPHPPPLHPSLLVPNPQALMFEAAARAHPEDSELHSALGVVYNLGRRYDDAVEAFRWGILGRRRQEWLGCARGCGGWLALGDWPG